MNAKSLLPVVIALNSMAAPQTQMGVPTFSRQISAYKFESPRHREATIAISHSDLGQRFLHYFFDPFVDAKTQSQQLADVLNHANAKGGKSITAQSALYFLITEIYKMGMFGDEQFRRLQLFQTAIQEQQATGPIYAGKHMTTITIIIALIATAIGWYQGSFKAIYGHFFNFLGPISFAYFFWMDQVRSAQGNSVFNELQDNDKRWQRFLTELEKM